MQYGLLAESKLSCLIIITALKTNLPNLDGLSSPSYKKYAFYLATTTRGNRCLKLQRISQEMVPNDWAQSSAEI